MTRVQKMALPTSRLNLAFVAHTQDADISEDNTNAYHNTVIVPCCFVKELRSLGVDSDLPFYWGCPKCRKALDGGLCPEHGSVDSPTQIESMAVVLQDPTGMWEGVLWAEPCSAFKTAFGFAEDIKPEIVLTQLAEKTACCELVARMTVGTNRAKDIQTVDFFDLAPAVTDEGAIASFQYLPWSLQVQTEGLAPVCCKALSSDNVGQLLVHHPCTSVEKVIDSALGLFCIESEPELAILPEVDGMVVKVKGKCVACGCVCTLQQAGVPQTVKKLIRINVREKLLAFIGLQGDGTQPFEIQQMRVLTSDAAQFEKLFKFQLAEYQK